MRRKPRARGKCARLRYGAIRDHHALNARVEQGLGHAMRGPARAQDEQARASQLNAEIAAQVPDEPYAVGVVAVGFALQDHRIHDLGRAPSLWGLVEAGRTG